MNQVVWGRGLQQVLTEPRYELVVGDTNFADFSEAFLVQVLLLSEATHVCATPALWNLVDDKPDHFSHLRRESLDMFVCPLISS